MKVKEGWETVSAYYEAYEYVKHKAVLFIGFALITAPFMLVTQFVFGNALLYWFFMAQTSIFTLLALGLSFVLRKMERQMKRMKELEG